MRRMRLPNGHTLVLGMTERILKDVQGPGAVDVVGDMVIDLDQNLQVGWTWNTFDHLPNSRKAILGELCKNNVPLVARSLWRASNDWTHCNSLYLLPDGNLALSIRDQDWVVKIHYQNGSGDGQILWTLGNLAEQAGTPYFTLQGGVGDWPWFSHQHDVEFDGTNYELFDNGTTRISPPRGVGSGNSRGQVYYLDEATMVATQLLSVDLGPFSDAFGSAQLLERRLLVRLGGFILRRREAVGRCEGSNNENSREFSYSVNFASKAYRTFRLSSFYDYEN